MVWGVDTLTGKKVEVAADLVVLAMAVVPSQGIRDLAVKLKISTDAHGFVNEAHPKLRPVETLTAGVYLAGCAQGPKDIPETVAQASGAASRVIATLSRPELEVDPLISAVDPDACTGCGVCVDVCSYKARELDEVAGVARVNEALCVGCGACVSACPSSASIHRNFSKRQLMRMVEEMV
jgi:heterodisulfide reductase subunit A